tara:strand:- start:1342 stop:1725 length:384 start_codon:yes stop_codon:yes gene_type:complete
MSPKKIKKVINPHNGDYFILVDSGDPIWRVMTGAEIDSSFQTEEERKRIENIEAEKSKLEEKNNYLSSHLKEEINYTILLLDKIHKLKLEIEDLQSKLEVHIKTFIALAKIVALGIVIALAYNVLTQ